MARKVSKPRVLDGLSLEHADPDQLFTVEQTAKLLGISDWMVRKQIQKQCLSAVFIENMTRIRAADIRAYITQRHHKAALLHSV